MNTSTGRRVSGHIAALFTAFVWGCTFISSKVLLEVLNPIEILFLRFVMGFILLLILHPRVPAPRSLKQELLFACTGLAGVTGYYLLENLALSQTLASIVSVITCAAPFFTALFAAAFLKEKVLTPFFFIGFAASIAGICMISFTGSEFSASLSGVLLAVGAAVCWGIYSVLVKKSSESGLNTLEMTQRFFFYGILFMAPFMKILGFDPDFSALLRPKYLLNLIFLGMIASAICFVTWNFALARLGTVPASVYIYLTPVITVLVSVPVLHERITFTGYIGIILTLAGLVISELKAPGK